MSLESLIEKYNVDNTKTLTKVEKIITPTLKAITKSQSMLLKINPENIKSVREFGKNVSANKSILDEWHKKLEALVKNKRGAYYMMLRNKANEEGVKLTSAPAEQESSLAVADERRLRDKVLGSLNSATEIIRTCRNILNNADVKAAE